MSDAVVLKTVGLSTGYGALTVSEDLELSAGTGEIVALLGRNGVGKTTALMTIAGAIPSLKGAVTLGGEELSGPLHRRARQGVAFIPETRAVVRKLSVHDNLRLAGVDTDRSLELFPELKPLVRRPAGLLSGGEQQMLVLARALATSPRFLLVDEMSFGLAPLIVRRLLDALREAVSQGNTGVILVEQHPHAALSVADRAHVMANGGIVLSGEARSLRARLPEIEEAYLSGSIRN